MLSKLRHRRFMAWLGMAAIWLTIVAPVVSRTLAVESFMPNLGAWCTGHGLAPHHTPEPSAPATPMDHCGYCTLLGHSPLLSGHTIVFSASTLPAASVPRFWAIGATFVDPVLSANPRGPPSLRHG